jgi:hypothetical protein
MSRSPVTHPRHRRSLTLRFGRRRRAGGMRLSRVGAIRSSQVLAIAGLAALLMRPSVAWAAQGLQGGWAVSDQGQINFVHSNFAQLLAQSNKAIKVADSGATVISGGLFGHDPGGVTVTVVENGVPRRFTKRGDQPGARPDQPGAPTEQPGATPSGGQAGPQAGSCSSTVPSGADYLCATYSKGKQYAGWKAGGYPLDQVGQHLYVDQGTTTSASKLKNYLQDLRNAYVFYEGSRTTKKTHVTEVGWSTSSISAADQATNLRTAYNTFKPSRQLPYVGRAYWFNIQDVTEASLFFGLVDDGGQQKASFSAYQTAAAY